MQTSSSSAEAGMPMSWVERIFDKLTMVYGHQFIGRWSGMDLAKVKADWAHELDGMQAHPESIKHALQHLPPDQPPTVLQFRDLCRKVPMATFKALPAPEINQAAAQAALAEASKVAHRIGDHLTPIRGLMAREIGGDKRLTKFQREFWRIALRAEIRHLYGVDTSQPFYLAALGRAVVARTAQLEAT